MTDDLVRRQMNEINLMLGDCLERLRELPDNSVDAIVTDPPYGLEFMGKDWDAPWKQVSGGFSEPGIGERETSWPSFTGSNLNRCEKCKMLIGKGGSRCTCDSPKPKHSGGDRMRVFQTWVTEWASECYRVLKPGGHLLAFAGTRTHHRMCSGIEDAGFEIRDMIAWVYGSGFPKSLDVSKAIDKAAGAEREVIGQKIRGDVEKAKTSGVTMAAADANKNNKSIFGYGVENLTAPATEAAQQWDGWGTALKPALEPITVARKPLIGTVAENVLAHGTGAINVDGCRVETDPNIDDPRLGGNGAWTTSKQQSGDTVSLPRGTVKSSPLGRWPANLIHDGSQMVLDLFPETTSGNPGTRRKAHDTNSMSGRLNITGEQETGYGDTGSAARFFYCAKTAKKDRGEANNHPTVKPTDLMRYLCRLVTQPGGTVLDPFMGSGSTGKAAMLEGFDFIGIEMNSEYFAIAKARIEVAKTLEGKE